MSDSRGNEVEIHGRQGSLDACREALEAHFAEHRTVPSMTGLSRLWGYASKSSAARRVDQLIAAGVLVWSPDKRLAPGPAFRTVSAAAAPGPLSSSPPVVPNCGDPLRAALTAWASDYDPTVVRAYSLTTRLLRAARVMEGRIAQLAATEGMTSGELQLLDALYRVGPPHRIAPTALKHYFLMSLAGVAKRVDRLEALGFIERVPNPDDRRGLFIQLTTSGQAVLRRMVEHDRTAPHIMWTTALSDQQYEAMLEGLAVAERTMAAPLDPDDGRNDRSN